MKFTTTLISLVVSILLVSCGGSNTQQVDDKAGEYMVQMLQKKKELFFQRGFTFCVPLRLFWAVTDV